MTKTAQKLIEELEKLPEEEQEEVATPLLKELRRLLRKNPRPLSEMVGAGKGLYETLDDVDEEINKQRDTWDY